MNLRLFLFVVVLLFIGARIQAQPLYYRTQWALVDSLIKQQGLQRKALEQVIRIYRYAKNHRETAQQIKSLLYQISLTEQLEEESLPTQITRIENELKNTDPVVGALLRNYLAQLYQYYFSQHRYELYDRTKIAGGNPQDLTTWSAADFHRKISSLFLQSLQPESILQHTALSSFEPILLSGNVRHLRPFLFDLLAFRALDYFERDEAGLSKPEEAYEINETEAFLPTEKFQLHVFQHPDTLSAKWIALKIYQKLLRAHLKKGSAAAGLIDADLHRLQFVAEQSVIEHKDSLYYSALQDLIRRFPNEPAADQVYYLTAQWHSDQGQKRTATGENHLLLAKQICEQVMKRKDSTEGKLNCQRLYQELLQQQFSVRSEKVNLPDRPFRALISYKNIQQIFIRIAALPDEEQRLLHSFASYGEAYWGKLVALPAIKTYVQPLPATTDLKEHQVEIKLDALPRGTYAITYSLRENFSSTENQLSIHLVNVSGLAWIRLQNELYVLDRETGAPVSDVIVQTWLRQYDPVQQQFLLEKGVQHISDKQGKVSLQETTGSNQSVIRLQLLHQKDHLFLEEDLYTMGQSPQVGPVGQRLQSFLFTDRSIYRPGQLLFFKGILIAQEGPDQQKAAANTPSRVYLRNANGTMVDSLSVTSNLYGSFSGQFRIPTGNLTGNYTLQEKTGNGLISFSVEEYKRPKFQVSLSPKKNSYQLNDSVTIQGSAITFSGIPLSAAQVKYRVVRKIYWPFWNSAYTRNRFIPYPSSSEQEIAHGYATILGEGAFTITFKALPDLFIEKNQNPVFYFEVQADVTDASGETRSSLHTLPLAWNSMILQFRSPAVLRSDTNTLIYVEAKNLSGERVTVPIQLTVEALEPYSSSLRERYWSEPDQFLYSAEEYHRYFPLDIYKNEQDPFSWKHSRRVLQNLSLDTLTGEWRVTAGSLPAGWYWLQAKALTPMGEEVFGTQVIEVAPTISQNPLRYGHLVAPTLYKIAEPNKLLSYSLQTNFDSLHILHAISRTDRNPEIRFLDLAKGEQTYSLHVAEKDRGGIYLGFAFVRHNRFYREEQEVEIPFDNKELTLSYQHFRDKTQPGVAEKWTIKVEGTKKDQVGAELLTALYDASLDEFKKHEWLKPFLWNRHPLKPLLGQDGGFSDQIGLSRSSFQPLFLSVTKKYDELLPLDLPGNPLYMMQDIRTLRSETLAPLTETVSANIPPDNPSTTAIRPQLPVTAPVSRSTPPQRFRKHFNETAFFFPSLHTDSLGNIAIEFTLPEALTTWRWMNLAHTPDLAFGYQESKMITQKEIMVESNGPRFFREGDRIDFAVKITNATEQELTGQVQLQLIDPQTLQPVDGWFRNFFPFQYFTVAAKGDQVTRFTIEIPYQFNRPVLVRAVANTPSFQDGEEILLPVLSDRVLMTTALPISIQRPGTFSYQLKALTEVDTTGEVNHHQLTVEMSSDPVWYAVQALPFLLNSNPDCPEQLFQQYYAHAMGKRIFDQQANLVGQLKKWFPPGTTTPPSLLERNAELKSIVLEETPWVAEAQSEKEQFQQWTDFLQQPSQRMQQQEETLARLQQLQLVSGGFPWFAGGPEDRYITQSIVSGIARLIRMKAIDARGPQLREMLQKSLSFLEKRAQEEYAEWKKRKQDTTLWVPSDLMIHYLYLRTLCEEVYPRSDRETLQPFYRKQALRFWLKKGLLEKGRIALLAFRSGELRVAQEILRSLEDNAIRDPELGMHWKYPEGSGFYGSSSTLETHALLCEAFAEIRQQPSLNAQLQQWLLKNKQTHHWPTRKASADACYVLLAYPGGAGNRSTTLQVKLGSKTVIDTRKEEALGYYKVSIPGNQIEPSLGKVTLTASGDYGQTPFTAWGALYWQYFTDLDKVTADSNPLQIRKEIFREENSPQGPVLKPLPEHTFLHVGDKITVRLTLRSDREVEYIHLKDQRASCLEPLQVLSSYNWKGGLGFYESTKDVSSHFYFPVIRKGTYTFEYSLFVTHSGTFQSGIATVESYYAPEFNNHSLSRKLWVE